MKMMTESKNFKKTPNKNIILINLKGHSFKARLNKSRTSEKLIKVLPVSSNIKTWGGEIYFTIPLKAELEDGVETVSIGTIAFWPPGSAFCIFFGKTPASSTEKPQAASNVTVLGDLVDTKKYLPLLKKIQDGEKVEIKMAEESLL